MSLKEWSFNGGREELASIVRKEAEPSLVRNNNTDFNFSDNFTARLLLNITIMHQIIKTIYHTKYS